MLLNKEYENCRKENNVLLYNADDMKMFIDSNCEEIISFVIGPIHKQYYEIICYTKNKDFRLLYSKNNTEKMLEFAKSYCSNKTTFDDFYTKTSKSIRFVKAYKNKFMTEIDISTLKEQLLLAKEFKSNDKEIKNWGLDGFSMDCKIFKTNEVFRIKQFSESKEYQVIIELANRILEHLGVESDNRFVIIDRS